MRVLLISGDHPRHLFVQKTFIESGLECKAIVMQRENLIPEPPKNISIQDKNNFIRHFEERYEVESNAYGLLKAKDIFSKIDVLYTKPSDFNSDISSKFVKYFQPDLAFIFGPDIIKSPLFDSLPKYSINMHLGLSPWYKGSATLFWPFYFLEPQFAGVTFHQIIEKADAGSILHQSVPKLSLGDGIHDVGVKAVIKAKNDLEILIDLFLGNNWTLSDQNNTGKLFLTRDFEPIHLRVVYNLFKNKIVDKYLNGELIQKLPKLIEAF